mmetsp:Transcript_20320/g.46100  ORF Transcript_20320/g.46100 Transcript_20320/m.46100 type:complete len:320 (-) Transcript_20320:419-1378(-)
MRLFTFSCLMTTLVSGSNPPRISKPYEPQGKFPPVNSLTTNSTSDSIHSDPPYWGTVYIDRSVLTQKDPNAARRLNVVFDGKQCRKIWHSHEGKWINVKGTYLFRKKFKDKKKIWIWVDSKYESKRKAYEVARKIVQTLGVLPEFLRKGINVVAILKDGISAHADSTAGVITYDYSTFDVDGGDSKKSWVEETWLHEAGHTSVDEYVYDTDSWNAAVRNDPTYISTYARDNPNSEDVAESLGAWYALKSGRLDDDDIRKINVAIPNRLALFDIMYDDDEDWFPIAGKISGARYKTPKKEEWNADWYKCKNSESNSFIEN